MNALDRLSKYAGTGCATTGQNTLTPGQNTFTLGDRIDQAVREADQRLQAAKRARQLLDQYPDIEELVNLLGRF